MRVYASQLQLVHSLSVSQEQLREDVQRKDRQLGEKREEVLLAKNEAQSFRSQLDTARVCTHYLTSH